jgi:hypothetical protein
MSEMKGCAKQNQTLGHVQVVQIKEVNGGITSKFEMIVKNCDELSAEEVDIASLPAIAG